MFLCVPTGKQQSSFCTDCWANLGQGKGIRTSKENTEHACCFIPFKHRHRRPQTTFPSTRVHTHTHTPSQMLLIMKGCCPCIWKRIWYSLILLRRRRKWKTGFFLMHEILRRSKTISFYSSASGRVVFSISQFSHFGSVCSCQIGKPEGEILSPNVDSGSVQLQQRVAFLQVLYRLSLRVV